jgi:hypothetical protein
MMPCPVSWDMVYDMVYGIWYMVYGIWYMVYGIWYMVYGIWYQFLILGDENE